ncbi:MAG: hypothetical protein ICV60_12920 [Pyrinomonadaceae bacterium]|nr:hypothetical protein [Pyrinomonadaceae bacterium]
MKGDFTRNTFDPFKHYTRVLMQQGRVQLDSDWNEQAAILLHYMRALAVDLIGPFGGPASNLGFKIFTGVTDQTSPPPQLLKISPADKDRLTKSGVLPLRDGDFLVSNGRYYVGGLLCENDDYSSVPEAYNIQQNGFYLAYLDVWEHFVTYLEDERMREVALGGPDTAARAKIIWQIKTWTAKPGETGPKIDDTTKREDIVNNWNDWVRRFEATHAGQLKAQAKIPTGAEASNPCLTSPDARYRGAENQLYRVEIHKGGKKEEATFKWSRENGSVIFPVLRYGDETVKLAHLGRDTRRGLKKDDWVEIFNDAMILKGTLPPLFQVSSIDPMDLTVHLKAPTKQPPFTPPANTPLFLRRWDHKGDAKMDGAVKVATTREADWISLEDGVQVQFPAGTTTGEVYRTGDYWLIPARTATGDVEWPRDSNGNAIAQSPHGIEHRYAPLAIIKIDTNKVASYIDCRVRIKPLVEFLTP